MLYRLETDESTKKEARVDLLRKPDRLGVLPLCALRTGTWPNVSP
jgi:hypothetical protein